MKSLRHRLLSFLARFEFFNSRMDMLKDKGKCVIFAGELPLKLAKLHPADRGASSIMYFLIIMVLVTIHVGLMYACLLENSRVDAIANILGLSNGGMQTIFKATAIFYQRKEFTKILKTMRYSFWPADAVDSATEEQIWTNSKKLLLLLSTQYVVPALYLIYIMIGPILKGSRYLPCAYCLLPNQTDESPIFEMVYAFQVITTVFLPLHIIGGNDNLYVTSCSICSAQFRLLRAAIRVVGSGHEGELIERLLRLPGVETPPSRGRSDKAKILLVICIKHHQNLLRFIDTLNRVFENGIFGQFVFSLAGIWANCYTLTIQTTIKGSVTTLAIYGSCLLQLLLFCAFSDDLSHLSADLANGAYESMWYQNGDPDVGRCLALVILRSQKAVCMNAYGLFELNHVSFMAVIRFSFSLYTFMSQVAT
uniref:Odorant receptor n=1 Tax=Protaetia brevitarsis TaxID=348688 RepID=A0A411HQY7_PROBE|nr:odorant receptor [Protaetia brevitarsis]